MATSVLEPQAALETACRDLIRAQLGYPTPQCDRTFGPEPPARCGLVFAAVWSDNQRPSESRTCLNEVFRLMVTLTVKMVKPRDRWHEHRDDLEKRVNAVRALIHADSYDFRVCRAAGQLMNADATGPPPALTPTRIGFREALAFEGMDAIRPVGPEWFQATGAGKPEVGLAQTLRFGKARLIQSLTTMV